MSQVCQKEAGEEPEAGVSWTANSEPEAGVGWTADREPGHESAEPPTVNHIGLVATFWSWVE